VPPQRLQKIIAAAGIASRRKAEELITQGRVSVNGQTVTELGSKADLERDHIKVDGKLLQGAERHVYLLLNKPKGYVTTVSDPEHRPTVMDLVKGVGARIYPVGRLDWSSEGLLLLTNDGELASKLTRAASHVPKTYLVKIAGRSAEESIDKLRRGIRIGAKPGPRRLEKAIHTAPAQIRLMKDSSNPWYEVTLIEGKNRQIRRMFEEIGHHVEKIKRVRYGPLTLDVEPGQYRELAPKEIAALKRADRTDRPQFAEHKRPSRSSDRGPGNHGRREHSARGRELKDRGAKEDVPKNRDVKDRGPKDRGFKDRRPNDDGAKDSKTVDSKTAGSAKIKNETARNRRRINPVLGIELRRGDGLSISACGTNVCYSFCR
jgi:23S rRNA pseudouridine2605 synthase